MPMIMGTKAMLERLKYLNGIRMSMKLPLGNETEAADRTKEKTTEAIKMPQSSLTDGGVFLRTIIALHTKRLITAIIMAGEAQPVMFLLKSKFLMKLSR